MKDKGVSRRSMLGYGAAFVCLAAGGTLVVPKLASAGDVVRPPGALKEKQFFAACIKCGQCLQVCPYHSIELMDIHYGPLSMGAPVITPSKRGCYLCDLLPCVLACPSGALDHAVSDAKDVMMGQAVITAPDECLAVRGMSLLPADIEALVAEKSVKTDVEKKLAENLRKCIGTPCRICAEFCPYPDKEQAIGFVEYKGGVLPEIRKKCVGCGVCEELCPAKVIHIVPVR